MSVVKVVFITPAADIRRNWVYRLGGSFYGRSNSITGPLILGSILKREGHEVEVYEELYKDLEPENIDDADVICIYTMTSNAPRAYELANIFKREYKKRVIIGGMHASALPEEALRYADQVVVGEAETVIVDLIEGNIKEKIVYAPPVEDLDSIPFPDYSVLKTPCQVANLMTSRGCPFSCIFCTTSRMFYPYRYRSPDNVIEELEMYKEMGFEYVNFEDDNFTANRERAKKILTKMIQNDLVFNETFFFGRTDLAKDEELLALLRDAHLNRVLIGIESLNQESLDYIDKKQKKEDIEYCGEMLEKYKIRLIASIVLGLDYDTKEDIRKAVKFSKKINAYQLQPAILTPYPGTPLYEQFEKEDRLLIKDWQYYDMMNVVFEPKNMSPWELEFEFFKAVNEFYNFSGAMKIFKIFGFEAGMRRLGLWIASKFGKTFFKKKSEKEDGNIYNQLYELSTEFSS
ncbi:B12-binding domain-containing radical SAM protein [Clostridium sp. Cult3]|nr:radical SAM protein [Clostridium sp. Cult3]MCF6460703.1 B12-binding domain-containing radical SAM protein [Clostridium sp. Cult3]